MTLKDVLQLWLDEKGLPLTTTSYGPYNYAIACECCVLEGREPSTPIGFYLAVINDKTVAVEILAVYLKESTLVARESIKLAEPANLDPIIQKIRIEHNRWINYYGNKCTRNPNNTKGPL